MPDYVQLTAMLKQRRRPRGPGGGQFAEGGGKEKKGGPTKASAKAMAAKQAHVYVGKDIQRYSEEHNEPKLAAKLKGKSDPDNNPADVEIGDGPVKAHGVELKTWVVGKNAKITMKGSAIAKKQEWQKRNPGAHFHTVVFDDRKVYNAKGKGKHGDEKDRQMYYRRGYGSFRVGTMHPVKDYEELQRLIDADTDDLPAAAKPGGTYVEPKRKKSYVVGLLREVSASWLEAVLRQRRRRPKGPGGGQFAPGGGSDDAASSGGGSLADEVPLSGGRRLVAEEKREGFAGYALKNGERREGYADVSELKSGGVQINESSLGKRHGEVVNELAKRHGSVRSGPDADEAEWQQHPNVREENGRFVVDEPVEDSASLVAAPKVKEPAPSGEGDAGSSSHKAWTDSLTDGEKKGIEEWSLGEYKNIRSVQAGRASREELSPRARDVLDGYESAMAKAPLTPPTTLHRGLYDQPADLTFTVGQEVGFRADSSTSRSATAAELFSTKKSRAGTTAVKFEMANARGVDIAGLEATIVKHEREVIVRKGTKYRVESVEEGEGKTNEGEAFRVLRVRMVQL